MNTVMTTIEIIIRREMVIKYFNHTPTKEYNKMVIEIKTRIFNSSYERF